MLARQRQTRILDELRRSGGVRVSELTELLGVSDMTIRRDLEQLESHGVLQKVHGGAVLSGTVTEEPGFEIKSTLQQPAKHAIAARAAALVEPGSAIAISAGTTTWAMAHLIATIGGLTVVTNSTTVADSIAAVGAPAAPTVILTGGVRTPSSALVGPIADLAIRSLHFDQLFLGCHGIDPVAGLTTPNLAEAETNRVLVRSARRVVVIADHTKWGIVGLSSFADLEEIDTLVTDSELPAEARALLTERVSRLVICDNNPLADALPH
jgi:DeoR/GlpR family transcriptional regulator of sugar metabolism